MGKKKFEVTRFHNDFGPESLFVRANFIFNKVKTLKLNGAHAKGRIVSRSVPQELIDHMISFDCKEWSLKVLEVRNDTGKFISSSWEYVIDDTRYWVVVGFHDTVQTIIVKDSSGKKEVIESGELYDFVETVNQDLMDKENLELKCILEE